MHFAPSAVLFDMHGVLIDSSSAYERRWRRWAEAHALDPAAVILQAHGRPTADTSLVGARYVAALAPKVLPLPIWYV